MDSESVRVTIEMYLADMNEPKSTSERVFGSAISILVKILTPAQLKTDLLNAIAPLISQNDRFGILKRLLSMMDTPDIAPLKARFADERTHSDDRTLLQLVQTFVLAHNAKSSSPVDSSSQSPALYPTVPSSTFAPPATTSTASTTSTSPSVNDIVNNAEEFCRLVDSTCPPDPTKTHIQRLHDFIEYLKKNYNDYQVLRSVLNQHLKN